MQIPGRKCFIPKGFELVTTLVYCLFPAKRGLKNGHFSDADGDYDNLGKSYSCLWVMGSWGLTLLHIMAYRCRSASASKLKIRLAVRFGMRPTSFPESFMETLETRSECAFLEHSKT